MNIDIFTYLAKNSAPYAQKLYENLTERSSGKHTLRFWAMVAQSDMDKVGYPKYWSIIPVDTDRIKPILQPFSDKPSVRHSKLLNCIGNYTPEDSNVTVIVDCDMFFYPKRWDDWSVRMLTEYEHDVIATEKHDGSARMFFMAMGSWLYNMLEPDYTPGVDKRYESEWTQNKQGQRVVSDTGWKLDDLFHDNEKEVCKLQLIDGDYYHLRQDGSLQLVCSHMGGSHKKSFNSKSVQNWYAECESHKYE